MSTTPSDPADAPARRGRPRSAGVERAILDAVVRLLEDGVPLGEVSMERIARTAGVGKAAIYRRWPGKEELLVDLMRSAEPPEPELPGTSVRDDLVALLEALRRRGVAKRSSAVLHTVSAQLRAYPRLWDAYHRAVIQPHRRATLDVLRRGVETGELRPDADLDLLGDLFVGPLMLRTLVTPDAALDEDLPARVVDTVLAGAANPAAPGSP
ncbi:TetR/AcrR family transcriptional regulator [Streptomyces sp. TRM64462]|uniref:TetR/AcrR family transcriptional regulator n=1 Tax=Streptomyces sp. TRM64462 TaxID=2741726 RepID=UPI001586B32A|nr:TetR/AcrR family transcriptional regulator [Streptomyces sp. TRM64462]